jgi:hypothetical protein
MKLQSSAPRKKWKTTLSSSGSQGRIGIFQLLCSQFALFSALNNPPIGKNKDLETD